MSGDGVGEACLCVSADGHNNVWACDTCGHATKGRLQLSCLSCWFVLGCVGRGRLVQLALCEV
jgi:hypothetical protein